MAISKQVFTLGKDNIMTQLLPYTAVLGLRILAALAICFIVLAAVKYYADKWIES